MISRDCSISVGVAMPRTIANVLTVMSRIWRDSMLTELDSLGQVCRDGQRRSFQKLKIYAKFALRLPMLFGSEQGAQ